MIAFRLFSLTLSLNSNFTEYYYGQVKPENLVFNANLQEFATRVGYITNLETSGKLSPEEAYAQIRALWKQLKRSKKELGIGTDTME